MNAIQPSLLELWPCDHCNGKARTIDPETGRLVACKVCGGTGLLDYDPQPVLETGNPFQGLEQQ